LRPGGGGEEGFTFIAFNSFCVQRNAVMAGLSVYEFDDDLLSARKIIRA